MIEQYFLYKATPNEFFAMMEELESAVNELADEMIHQQYAEMLTAHECTQIAKKIGIELKSPIANFLQGDKLSIITAAFSKAIDANKKLQKAQFDTDIFPEFNFMSLVQFCKLDDMFLLKLKTASPLVLQLMQSNTSFIAISLEDEEYESLQSVNFEYAYSIQLYKGIRPIRPNYLLSSLNERYTFTYRLNTFPLRLLGAQLSKKEDFIQKSEAERAAYLSSPDARIRLQVLQAQVEPLLIDTYTKQFLLQKE